MTDFSTITDTNQGTQDAQDDSSTNGSEVTDVEYIDDEDDFLVESITAVDNSDEPFIEEFEEATDKGNKDQDDGSDESIDSGQITEIFDAYGQWLTNAESDLSDAEYDRATTVLKSGTEGRQDSEISAEGPAKEQGSAADNQSHIKTEPDASPVPEADSSQPTAKAPPPKEESWTFPKGGGEYVIQPGDSLSSIAASSGHFWKTIWNDPANRDLVNARKYPNLLLPGDRIHIPPIREREEPAVTEKCHRFIRKGVPDELRLRFLIEGKPLAGEPYEIAFDIGKTMNGTLDGEGRLVTPISGKAKEATVRIGSSVPIEYHFLIGHLDPLDSITGIQQRLLNLGYFNGPIDGNLTAQTRAAISEFQADYHELTVSGTMDKSTRDKLHEVHDSRFQ